ncbi:MAG: FAD-binding protein [Methanobacteriota archaeon]
MRLLDAIMNSSKLFDRYSPLVEEMPVGPKKELAYVFGDRVSFDPAVREAHSVDAVPVPAALEALLKKRAQAVLFPQSKGDLYEIVKFAEKQLIPVVPRGAGTGFFNGAVPTEGGVVVSMRALSKVLAFDEKEMTATAEAGILLGDLEEALNAKGLALRVYPGSFPGGTLGGWLAQGLGGVGSLAHGPVGSSVVSAEMLLPNGKLRRFSGPDLDLVTECCGATGFITEVTLKVRKNEPVLPLLYTFDDVQKAAQAANYVGKLLPAWSATLATPGFLAIRDEATKVKGAPAEKFALLVVLARSDESRRTELDQAMVRLGGKAQDAKVADKEWSLRARAREIQRLGPTLFMAEVRVPVESVGEALEAAARAIPNEDVGFVATLVSKREAAITAYVPEDERRGSYPVAVGLGLALLDTVRPLGGRPASVGLEFSHEAESVLGKDRFERVMVFKKDVDGSSIFNPGKVTPASVKGAPPVPFSLVMKLSAPILKGGARASPHDRAHNGQPATPALYYALGRVTGGRLAEHSDAVFAALGCSSCDANAPTASRTVAADAPRGWMGAARAILLGEGRPSRELAGRLRRAAFLRRAEERCPNAVPKTKIVQALRAEIDAEGLALAEHAALGDGAKKNGNHLGKPKADRAKWAAGVATNPAAKAVLFADCTAAYERPGAVQAAASVLANGKFAFTHLGDKEQCSGDALLAAGQAPEAVAAAVANADAVAKAAGAGATVVCLTAGAYEALKYDYAALLRGSDPGWNHSALHFANVAKKLVDEKRLSFAGGEARKIVYHPACHVPHGAEIDKDAEALLKSIPGLTVLPPLDAWACGADAAFRAADAEGAKELAAAVGAEAKKKGAQAIVTSCPDCSQALAKCGVDVVDLADLVAKTMAVEAPATAAAGAPARAVPIPPPGKPAPGVALKPVVDQPRCISCAICYTKAPMVFAEASGGKAYVADPDGWKGYEKLVVAAALECPPRCISLGPTFADLETLKAKLP